MKRIQISDQATSLFQDNVASALAPIEISPLIGGQLLTNIELTAGQDNLVNHQLGYAPTMILPLVANVDTRIWSPATALLSGSNASNRQINLRTFASCIIGVFVK